MSQMHEHNLLVSPRRDSLAKRHSTHCDKSTMRLIVPFENFMQIGNIKIASSGGMPEI
jgi:hypothetical protein